MEQKRFEFILEARQPIAHHEETIGNTSVLMRRKVRMPDGGWSRVPAITADTMRHGLREAASYATLDAAGMLGDSIENEAALRLLFSGGMITGASGGAVKLGDYREMVDVFPPLALFGGCAQNRSIPGRMCVDDAVLLCDETAHLMPAWVEEWRDSIGTALDSHRAHVEEVQRVRMDPTLDPGKRQLLTAGAREGAEQRLLKSENAAEMGDDKAKQEAKSGMMPRRFERIAAGSLFHWSVTATCYSELDVDTFMATCASFLHDARVGGKKGTGHGLVKPITARNVHLRRMRDRAETLDADGLGGQVGTLFQNHVQERADKLRSFLEQVAA